MKLTKARDSPRRQHVSRLRLRSLTQAFGDNTHRSIMGMVCIYCRGSSDTTHGLAHVFPEAVVANAVTLPLGTVCDRCNNYLSSLDTILAAHPWISFAVQSLGLPGKQRRVRKELSGVSRNVRPGWVTVETAEPRTVVARDGTRTTTFEPLIDSRFDLKGFRRALYHVGLNSVAHRHGAAGALSAEYDEVRRYVRYPHKGEEWGFAQRVAPLDRIRDEVGVDHVAAGDRELVCIVAFNFSFYVDLQRPDALKNPAALGLPSDTEYLHPGYQLPRYSKGRRRFRVSIELPHK